MDDLFSKINELLSDPVQGEKIRQIAASMAGGAASTGASGGNPLAALTGQSGSNAAPASADAGTGLSVPASVPTAAPAATPQLSDILGSAGGLGGLASLLPGLSSLPSGLTKNIPSSAAVQRNISLLNAIKPYMRATRSAKIDSAVKLMQMVGMISQFK